MEQKLYLNILTGWPRFTSYQEGLGSSSTPNSGHHQYPIIFTCGCLPGGSTLQPHSFGYHGHGVEGPRSQLVKQKGGGGILQRDVPQQNTVLIH